MGFFEIPQAGLQALDVAFATSASSGQSDALMTDRNVALESLFEARDAACYKRIIESLALFESLLEALRQHLISLGEQRVSNLGATVNGWHAFSLDHQLRQNDFGLIRLERTM